MPYNPGVQSIAGQLYAQAGENLGRAISEGIREYSQNKLMAGKAVAKFEGASSRNPEMLQFLTSDQAPPETAKAFAKLQKNGAVGLRDAAVLATFAETYAQEKAQEQATQLRDLQLRQFQRQEADAAASANALRFATRSPTSDAIQGGASFEQIVSRNVPTTRPTAEIMNRFVQAGGVPSPEMNQFLNVRADNEAQNNATAARAAAAEAASGRKDEALALAKERAEIERQRADTYATRATKTFDDGDERPVTINNATRTAFFSRGTWLDKETGLPITTSRRDMLGNVQDGIPNPVLFGASDGTALDTAEPWNVVPKPKAPTVPGKEFTKGKIYRDMNGNRAKYLGDGKWEPMPK